MNITRPDVFDWIDFNDDGTSGYSIKEGAPDDTQEKLDAYFKMVEDSLMIKER